MSKSNIKKVTKIPIGYISAAFFVEHHELSSAFASAKSKVYPNAFVVLGRSLFFNPSEVSYKNDELNMLYNGKRYTEFKRIVDDVYFHLDHYYNDFNKAKLLARLTGKTIGAWSTMLTEYNFRPTQFAILFVRYGKFIIKEVEMRLSKDDHYDCDMYKK